MEWFRLESYIKNRSIQIKIKFPKNKKLINDLNPMFQEIEENQQAVKNADELYKKYIFKNSATKQSPNTKYLS